LVYEFFAEKGRRVDPGGTRDSSVVSSLTSLEELWLRYFTAQRRSGYGSVTSSPRAD